jgi:hypothetical protein
MVADPCAIGPNVITFKVLKDTMGKYMTFQKSQYWNLISSNVIGPKC